MRLEKDGPICTHFGQAAGCQSPDVMPHVLANIEKLASGRQSNTQYIESVCFDVSPAFWIGDKNESGHSQDAEWPLCSD
jgi:hypothetical protein